MLAGEARNAESIDFRVDEVHKGAQRKSPWEVGGVPNGQRTATRRCELNAERQKKAVHHNPLLAVTKESTPSAHWAMSKRRAAHGGCGRTLHHWRFPPCLDGKVYVHTLSRKETPNTVSI